MDPEISISPQYLQKQPIEVTILKIINPAHFIVKETPRKCMSKEAKQFLALEDKITHYYDSFEPIFSQLPTKGSLVIVQPGGSKQKWFRARVSSILDSTKGPCVSAYLVDYGRICTVTRNCIYTVCEDFLKVPFQAVEFKLSGLKPAGYSVNLDTTLKFGLVSKWDISAEEHVSNVWKEMTNAQIEILGFDQGGCLYGNLNIQQGDHSFCLNQQLLKDEYAVLLHDESPKVFSIEEILNARCQDNVQNTPQGLRCENQNDITLENRSKMEKESKKQLKEKLESFRENLRKRENEERCENKSCSTSVTDDKFRKLLHLIKPKASANSSDTKELGKQNIVSIEKEINDIKEMPWSSAMQNTSDSGQAFSSKNKSPHMPRLSLSEHSKVSFHNINQVPMCDNANNHILNKQTINRNGFTRTTLENSKPLVQRSIQNVNSLTERITVYGLKKNENGNHFLEYSGLQSSSLPLKNINSGTTSENHIKKSVTLDKFAMLKRQIYSKPLCPQTKVSYHNKEILCDETLPKVEQSSNESIVSSLTSKDSFLKLVKEKTAETNLVLSELPNSNSVPTFQMKSVNICSQKNEMRNINENLIILRDTVEQHSEKRDLKRHSISSSNHIQDNQSSFCNSSDVPELVIPEILPYSVSKPSSPNRSKSETMTSPADPFKKLQRLVKGKSVGRKITSENTISKLDSPGVQSNSNSASYTSSTNINPKNEKSKKPDQDALFEECKWPEKVAPEIWLNASCKNQLQMNQQGNQPVLCNSPSMPESLPLVKMPDTSSDSILSNHDLSELNSVPAKDRAQENINSANMCHITEMKEADQVAFKLNDPEDLLEGVVQKNKFEEQNKVLSDASNVSYTLLNSETSEQSDVEKKQEIKYPFNGINIDAQERISLEEFCDENIGTAFFKTNLDFSDKTLSTRQRVPALMHGCGIPKPLTCTEEAPFVEFVKKRLKELKFWGPSCIQSVVWPAVFRNRWIVAITPPHSGKTLACILPLISNILQQTTYKDLPSGNGPILLVLCSSWKKAQSVYAQCQLFVQGSRQARVLLLYSGGADKNKKVSLLNGCEILVSTPSCLLRFLQTDGEPVTNFDRCCHLLLDDADSLNEDEIGKIVKEFSSVAKKRVQFSLPLQIMLCAEKWTKRVACLYKCFPNPLLFFTSFLESAVYAQIPVHVHVCSSSRRNYILLNLLESIKSPKIVICTTNVVTALEVRDILQGGAVYALLVHEQMMHYNIDDVKRNWNILIANSSRRILIVTDKALVTMDIRNANCIIHYDLPEISRLQFGQRFNCISDSFSTGESENEESIVHEDCLCHIIVTENCQVQTPDLVKFLKRMGSEIPSALKNMAHKQYQIKINQQDPLCHYMKAYGVCSEAHCLKRHTISTKMDQPNVVPFQGEVKAVVNFIIDATHFYARILEYYDPITHTTKFLTAQYAEICHKLKMYYSISDNKVNISSVKVGDECATEDIGTTFSRIKVLQIIEYSNNKARKVCVQFVDDGYIKNLDVNELFLLPNELRSIPPLAVEVYICKLKTLDSCSDFTPQANLFVHTLIGKKEVEGKIVLCLGRTIWLDPIVIRNCQLKYIHEPVNLLKVDKAIRDAGYALGNPHHLMFLFDACKDKVLLPLVYERRQNKNQTTDNITQISHAFLDLGTADDVFVPNVKSPHRFFVQRAKFVECLDSLLDDISRMVQNKEVKHCHALQKGMYCLAPLPEDNRYYRSQIENVTEIENSDEIEVQVFFVDFGDSATVTKEDLYALPSKLLLLPFQAIECELAGVCPPHGGWTEQSTDVLLDLTRNDENSLKQLHIKALQKSPCYSGGYHYVVELYDTINFSEQLVKEGLALPAEIPQLEPQVLKPMLPVEIEEFSLGYESTSDNGLLSGEKDAAALFFGALCGVISRKDSDDISDDNSQNVKLKPAVSETAMPLQTSFANCEKLLKPIKLQPELHGLPPLIAIKGQCKRHTPQVTWWNTKQEVTLSVKLIGVKLFDFTICETGFNFSTTLGDKFYCLEETFYAEVYPEKTKSNCLYQSVELIFMKVTPGKWPRLLSDNQKVSYLKPDFNHLESDSESKSDSQKHCLKSAQSEGATAVDSTESEDEISSDDLPDNTWKKTCETYDPYNIFH